MKRFIARRSILAVTALALLFAFCFVQPPVGARVMATAADPFPLPADDHRDGPRFSLPPFGFVRGQTLRLTVAHVIGQAGQNQPPPDVNVGVWLLDSSGRVIAKSAQVQIPLEEFRYFDFKRETLNLPGEPGTGRLQVRALLMMNVAEPYHFTADPKASSMLVPTLEIVDNNTGMTRQNYNPYITVDYLENVPGRTTANNLKQIGLAIHHVETQH